MRKAIHMGMVGTALACLLAMALSFPWAAAAIPPQALQEGIMGAEPTPVAGTPGPEPPTASPEPPTASPEPPPVTATAKPAETPSPSPSPAPALPQPLPWLPPEVSRFIASYSLQLGLSCLLLFLLVLAVVLILILWRGQRRPPRPVTPPRPPGPPPPPPARLPRRPCLQSVAAPGNPCFELKPEGVTIGRGPENNLVITQDLPGWETVSQQHARIYCWADRWIVEDLSSANGVYVNGRRTGRNVLRDGWRIGIGGVEFEFHVSAEETEP